MVDDRASSSGSRARGKPFSLSRVGSLTLLLIAASIPVLLFAGWIVYRAAEEGIEDARVSAMAAVDRVAERVRAEMISQIQVAQTLALSATLDEPDLPSFYREAERLKAARQLWFTVELGDLKGNQILNLLRPLGAALGPTADRASFEEALSTRQPVVGGIGPIGPISGKKLVTVRVPVEREKRLRAILSVAFDPTAISSILRSSGVPEGWIGAVVDGTGNIIARNVKEEETLGRPASSKLRETIAKDESGRYSAHSLEGTELDVVFQSIAGIGRWSVHLGAAQSQLEAPLRRSYFVLAGGVAASLALAIGLAVLTNRELARQRSLEEGRAAAALTASERQGALAIQAADLGSWRWDLASERFSGSARARHLLGLPADDGEAPGWTPDQFLAAGVPGETARLDAAVRAAVHDQEPFGLDIEAVFADTSRWLRLQGRSAAGPPGTVIGVIADVTAQKRAEADRTLLLQRIADAQEQMQARIARELHDQVGQTVTGLSLGLKSVEQLLDSHALSEGSSRSHGDAIRDKVRWLRTLANTVGREIHQAATDLRPTALDDLGLARALRAQMEGWSRRFDIVLDFQEVELDSSRLPADIETAIYRVAQEALTNIIKHAEAKHVSVVIERRSREVRLVIEDDGIGFESDMTGAVSHQRLGVSGMRERLAFVGGTLRIESSRGGGTSVFIRVPLPPWTEIER